MNIAPSEITLVSQNPLLIWAKADSVNGYKTPFCIEMTKDGETNTIPNISVTQNPKSSH